MARSKYNDVPVSFAQLPISVQRRIIKNEKMLQRKLICIKPSNILFLIGPTAKIPSLS